MVTVYQKQDNPTEWRRVQKSRGFSVCLLATMARIDSFETVKAAANRSAIRQTSITSIACAIAQLRGTETRAGSFIGWNSDFGKFLSQYFVKHGAKVVLGHWARRFACK